MPPGRPGWPWSPRARTCRPETRRCPCPTARRTPCPTPGAPRRADGRRPQASPSADSPIRSRIDVRRLPQHAMVDAGHVLAQDAQREQLRAREDRQRRRQEPKDRQGLPGRQVGPEHEGERGEPQQHHEESDEAGETERPRAKGRRQVDRQPDELEPGVLRPAVAPRLVADLYRGGAGRRPREQRIDGDRRPLVVGEPLAENRPERPEGARPGRDRHAEHAVQPQLREA